MSTLDWGLLGPPVTPVGESADWGLLESPSLPAGKTSTTSGPSAALIGAAVFGQLSMAYGQFSAARMASYEAKAQASAMGHRSRMLQLDRRAAELRAQSILEQGQAQIGDVGLAGSQRRASIEASTAARGVESGVGSAAEVQVSERLMEQIDAYHINLASVQAANAARAGATAIANEALLTRTSAANFRRSAKAARPETYLASGIGQSLLTGYMLGNYRRP